VKIASEFDPASAQQLTRQSRDRQSSVDAWLRQMEAVLMAQAPVAAGVTPEGAASSASRTAVDRPRAGASSAWSGNDPVSAASMAGERRTAGAFDDGRADTAASASTTAARRPSAASATADGDERMSAEATRSGAETSATAGGLGIQSHAHPFGKGWKQASGAHGAAAASPDLARSPKAHFANPALDATPAIGRATSTAPMRPLAFASQQASTRDHDSAEATHEPGQRAQHAQGDDVLERSMHVHHDGDEVSVTMRDTTLTNEQRTAVIGSLANEFRLAGMRLRSATINGESSAVPGTDAEAADRFTQSLSADAVSASPNTSTPWKGSRHG
jgi:hypothetical protein